MLSDTIGCARKLSEAFGQFRKFSYLFIFETFFALAPNTGEACDETCAATAPIISEMCALRLESNNQLLGTRTKLAQMLLLQLLLLLLPLFYYRCCGNTADNCGNSRSSSSSSSIYVNFILVHPGSSWFILVSSWFSSGGGGPGHYAISVTPV